jgi:transcriptional regulator with XRE-family HTH domain
MSTGYLSRLESGTRSPTGRAVTFLAERLGVGISAFETSEAQSLAGILARVVSAAANDSAAEPLAKALREDEGSDPALRWQGLWLLSEIRNGHEQYGEELAALTELVELSDEFGSAELRVRARTRLSRCLRLLDDNAKARYYASEAHSLSDSLTAADRAAALQELVSAEAEIGWLPHARMHADELCALTAPAGGMLFAKALWSSADVGVRQADYKGALDLLQRALRELDGHADLMLWLRFQLATASLYLQLSPQMIEQARASLEAVTPVLAVVGNDLHRQQMLALQAHLAFAEGRIDDARALADELAGQTLLLSFRDRLRFHALGSQLRILGGEVVEGVRGLQELAEQAEAAANVELAAEIWRTLAKTLADSRS